MIAILLFVLIAAAVLPLVALGVVVIADRLGWAASGRLLDLASRLAQVQWVIGGVLSVVVGAALIAVGAWLLFASFAWEARLAVVLLVPFGLWRIWRGVSVLRSGEDRSTEGSSAGD